MGIPIDNHRLPVTEKRSDRGMGDRVVEQRGVREGVSKGVSR